MTNEIFEYFQDKYAKASIRVVPGHWPDFKSKEEVDKWIELHETELAELDKYFRNKDK